MSYKKIELNVPFSVLQIKKLNKSFYELQAKVMLSYNQIAKLPSVKVKKPALQWLDISHNSLASIPSNIDKVYTLVFLDMSYNKLEVSLAHHTEPHTQFVYVFMV